MASEGLQFQTRPCSREGPKLDPRWTRIKVLILQFLNRVAPLLIEKLFRRKDPVHCYDKESKTVQADVT